MCNHTNATITLRHQVDRTFDAFTGMFAGFVPRR